MRFLPIIIAGAFISTWRHALHGIIGMSAMRLFERFSENAKEDKEGKIG